MSTHTVVVRIRQDAYDRFIVEEIRAGTVVKTHGRFKRLADAERKQDRLIANR